MLEHLPDPSRRRRWGIRFALLGLYLLGLNPYLAPGLNDNAEYMVLAENLGAGDGYQIDGVPVVDRAPLMPLFLAPFTALGIRSPLALKALLLIPVLAGIALVDRIARRHASQPWPVTALFALLPASLYFGTEIMSEWTYLVCSLAFLLLLQRVGTPEAGHLGSVLAGIVLAMAIGARYVGAVLVVSVIVRMARHWKERSVRPEVLTLLVASVPTVGWILASRNSPGRLIPEFLRNLLFQAGVPPGGSWAQWNLGDFVTRQWTNFRTLLRDLADLLSGGADALRWLGFEGTYLETVLLLLFAGLVTLGLVDVWRHDRRVEEIAYVVATIVLLSATGWLRLRYLVPIAPFLVLYVVRALNRIFQRPGRRVAIAALAIWSVALLAGDAIVLFRGNPSGPHGGISMLASRTEADFYRGESRELYDVCLRLRDEPEPGSVACRKPEYAYLRLYSGRAVEQDGRFVVVRKPDAMNGRVVMETPHYLLIDRFR